MSNNLVEIKKIEPALGSSGTWYMLEPCTVLARIHSQHYPENIVAEIWTNVIDKISPDGEWHVVPMHLQSHTVNDTYSHELEFQGIFVPTDQGIFDYTVRFGLKRDRFSNPVSWQWAGPLGHNGSLKVLPPSPFMDWTQGPQAVEIAPGVVVGNFVAASKAPQLGYQAVLNMAEELNLIFPDDHIEYKKISLSDGAHNPIQPEKLKEAVSWVQQQVARGYKVCINCRAGIGRSGSVAIAYLYATHQEWSYQQTLAEAWAKKPNIYPHKNLEQTLSYLFPRSQNLRP